MINLFPIAIIILCLLVLFIYLKVKKFFSFSGFLMFSLAFLALFLRFSVSKEYPPLGLYNPGTMSLSFTLIGIPVLIFIFVGYFSKNFKKRYKRLNKILLPYIFFGAVQQIFFFLIFTDSFYYITNNIYLTLFASMTYFIWMHFGHKSSIQKYWPLVVVFAAVSSWIYVFWGNIVPQMLAHGVAGSILFTEFTNTDQLKARLG